MSPDASLVLAPTTKQITTGRANCPQFPLLTPQPGPGSHFLYRCPLLLLCTPEVHKTGDQGGSLWVTTDAPMMMMMISICVPWPLSITTGLPEQWPRSSASRGQVEHWAQWAGSGEREGEDQ